MAFCFVATSSQTHVQIVRVDNNRIELVIIELSYIIDQI